MSYAAGRWLHGWSWRLLMLGWLTILVDLLLYTAAVISGGGYDNHPELLVYGFYGSQVSVGIIWGMLGSPKWRHRLAGAALAAAPAAYFLLAVTGDHGYADASWLAVALIQALGVVGMCGLLRSFGYRIDRMEEDPVCLQGGALQFSISHMLIWTASAAVIVSIAKQVVIYSAGGHGWREWTQLAIDGTVLAIVALSAMWMVLGAGRVWLKVLIGLAIAASAGAFLWYLDWKLMSPGIVWLPRAGLWWIGWSLLAEPFLAGLLLVFQTTGYRLLRRRRLSS